MRGLSEAVNYCEDPVPLLELYGFLGDRLPAATDHHLQRGCVEVPIIEWTRHPSLPGQDPLCPCETFFRMVEVFLRALMFGRNDARYWYLFSATLTFSCGNMAEVGVFGAPGVRTRVHRSFPEAEGGPDTVGLPRPAVVQFTSP